MVQQQQQHSSEQEQQQYTRVDSLPIPQDTSEEAENDRSKQFLSSSIDEPDQEIRSSHTDASKNVEDREGESTISESNLPSPDPTPTDAYLTKTNSSNPVSAPAPALETMPETISEIKPEQASTILSSASVSKFMSSPSRPSDEPIPAKLQSSNTNALRTKPDLKLDISDITATDQPLESAKPRDDPSPLRTKATRLKANLSHQTPPISLVILNKPLPPLTKESTPSTASRK
ncbi:hypothetical protein FB639_000476, partial [Coemansia asiatica]